MGKTVFFRSLEDDDLDLIYQWMNDDDLKKLSVGLNKRLSKDECRNWIATHKNNSNYQYYWAICSVKDSILIGYAYITNIHFVNRTSEFGGIIIGNPDYHNGVAWIETYLFVLDFVFNRLNINRFTDTAITEHIQSNKIAEVLYFQKEGVLREAVYKNGRYYDLSLMSLLSKDYHAHLEAGDYDFKKIIKRFAR